MTPDKSTPGWTKDLPDTYEVDLRGVADIAGIQLSSARAYHSIAKGHRKQAELTGQPGIIRPGDLPAPDDHKGQSPVWSIATLKKWMASRPGQGVYVGKHGRQKVVEE